MKKITLKMLKLSFVSVLSVLATMMLILAILILFKVHLPINNLVRHYISTHVDGVELKLEYATLSLDYDNKSLAFNLFNINLHDSKNRYNDIVINKLKIDVHPLRAIFSKKSPPITLVLDCNEAGNMTYIPNAEHGIDSGDILIIKDKAVEYINKMLDLQFYNIAVELLHIPTTMTYASLDKLRFFLYRDKSGVVTPTIIAKAIFTVKNEQIKIFANINKDKDDINIKLAAKSIDISSFYNDVLKGSVGIEASTILNNGASYPSFAFKAVSDVVKIYKPEIFDAAASFYDVLIEGDYNTYNKTAIFDQIKAKFDKLELKFDGNISPNRLEFSGCNPERKAISYNALIHFWPKIWSAKAKSWIVNNIDHGDIEVSEVKLYADIKNGVINDLQSDTKLALNNVVFHDKVRNLLVKDIDADMEVWNEKLAIKINNGSINNNIVSGDVKIDAFSAPITTVNVMLKVSGAITDFLQALPSTHVDSAKILEKFSNLNGFVNSNIKIYTELGKNSKDLSLSMTGKVSDASLEGSDGKYIIFTKSMDIEYKNDNLNIKGYANINNYENTFLNCTKDIMHDAPIACGVTASFTAAELKAIGYDVANIMKGKIDIIANIAPENKVDISTVKLDLVNAEIYIPYLGINKPVGDAAQLVLSNIASPEKRYDLTIGNIKSIGTINTKNGAILGVSSKNTSIDKQKFSFMVNIKNKAKSIEVSILNGILNVTDILTHSLSGRKFYEDGKGANAIYSVLLKSSVDSIVSNGIIIHKPGLELLYDGIIKKFVVSGNFDGTKAINVFYDKNILKINSEDAGSFFTALGFGSKVSGGIFSINGQATGNGDIIGGVELKEFYAHKSTLLSKILALASITSRAFGGIKDLFDTRGLFFKKLVASYIYNGNELIVKEGRLRGNVLSMTADGNVNLKNGNVDIKGLAIPENLVNSIAKMIPLFNIPFGKDKGLIAVNYKMVGNIRDEISINVNPLSILTPGFLKHIFQF